MEELWQLYGEDGKPISGKGEVKAVVFEKGILHAASHVWIWRENSNGREVLLQKRAPGKRTWPNRYDISAAGHIDLGELPIEAAIRETKEEIGFEVDVNKLAYIGVHRAHLRAGDAIENEFQFLYSFKLDDNSKFTLESEEVGGIIWRSLDEFEVDTVLNQSEDYVPHGPDYYQTIIDSVRKS